VIGGATFLFGTSLPVFTDYDAARELYLNGCDAHAPVAGYYEQMDALRTWRHPLMQSGLSLVLAGLTLFGLYAVFGGTGEFGMRTPKGRPAYFALGLAALLLSWFAQAVSLSIDLDRMEFPMCADSIGIPLMGLFYAFTILIAASLVVGLLLSLGFRKLPVALFQWRKDQPVRSWLITIPFALIGLVIALLGILTAPSSAFLGTPASLLALYLVEATRSALLAPAPKASE